MAIARVHVWAEGEVLTASDLNGEFNNLINNPLSFISPLTGTLDVNGQTLANVINLSSYSGSGINLLISGTPSFSVNLVNNQTYLQTKSTNASSGSVLQFFHDVNPLDGQTPGSIHWIGNSGGFPWIVGQHYLVRSEADDASIMSSIQVFTVQNAANQTGANVTATLSSVGVWTDASGKAIKRYIDEPMEGVLDKFKVMNTLGVYVGKHAPVDGERHYSSTAEEFYDIFGLGNNPSNNPELAGIAPKDVSWLAVKAIMELEQRVACLEVK